jgi:hypothetical protein
MAAGRPMLFIGPRDSTPARIIDRFACGWRVEPGEVQSVVSILERLAADRCAIYTAGANSRTAFEAHYDRKIGAARVAAILGLQQATPTAEAASDLTKAIPQSN